MPEGPPSSRDCTTTTSTCWRWPQRVVVTGGPQLPPAASPGLERGPVKLVIPDHAPVAFDDVLAGVRAARAVDRAVAIHCVTRAAAVLALAALEEVGPHP